jgi:hypothetical protein
MIKLLSLDREIDPVNEERGDLLDLLSQAIRKKRDATLIYRYRNAAFICGILDRNPKEAEWKARRRLEESKEWAQRKKDLLDTDHDVEILRATLGLIVIEDDPFNMK